MIIDAIFKVFCIVAKGAVTPVYAVFPTKAEAQDLMNLLIGERVQIREVTINATRELENLLGKDLTDAEFEVWEYRALHGLKLNAEVRYCTDCECIEVK